MIVEVVEDVTNADPPTIASPNVLCVSVVLLLLLEADATSVARTIIELPNVRVVPLLLVPCLLPPGELVDAMNVDRTIIESLSVQVAPQSLLLVVEVATSVVRANIEWPRAPSEMAQGQDQRLR